MEYENIVFDLYGTLVDIWTDEQPMSLWRKLAWFFCLHQAQYQPAELKEAYFSEVENQEKKLQETTGEYAEIDLLSVFSILYKRKGICAQQDLLKETLLMFRALSLKRLKLYPGVEKMLKSLKDAGKRIYLLTNAQKVITEAEIKLLGLGDCFDGIMYSSEEGIKKPDVNFYQKLIDQYQLNKEKTVMVGNDGFCDIKGALLAGISALHIASNIEGKQPCPKEVKSLKIQQIALIKKELLK